MKLGHDCMASAGPARVSLVFMNGANQGRHISLHMRIVMLRGSHVSSWWRTRAKRSNFKCANTKGGSGLNTSLKILLHLH